MAQKRECLPVYAVEQKWGGLCMAAGCNNGARWRGYNCHGALVYRWCNAHWRRYQARAQRSAG